LKKDVEKFDKAAKDVTDKALTKAKSDKATEEGALTDLKDALDDLRATAAEKKDVWDTEIAKRSAGTKTNPSSSEKTNEKAKQDLYDAYVKDTLNPKIKEYDDKKKKVDALLAKIKLDTDKTTAKTNATASRKTATDYKTDAKYTGAKSAYDKAVTDHSSESDAKKKAYLKIDMDNKKTRWEE